MALNPLVSLFGRLVARSARIGGTGQTDGRTDRMACAPRVNDRIGHICQECDVFAVQRN